MTISIRLLNRRGRRAFTLVEVLMASTLGTLVLAGVLSALLFIARTSIRASSYSELDGEVRRGLDTFARDVRNAYDVRWNNSKSVTLVLNVNSVTYAYDTNPTSDTYQCFYRVVGDALSPQPRTILIHNLDPNFAFNRYKLQQPGIMDNRANNDGETKLLQVTLRAIRTGSATITVSDSAVSARYVLRNKRVSN